mmetsp:Transcript_1691/g.3763  ORF Transcript_1691/g.3763 Transcript_1691/m.3763 type:complete len:93 (+) Transcript_1691:494-772(+)
MMHLQHCYWQDWWNLYQQKVRASPLFAYNASTNAFSPSQPTAVCTISLIYQLRRFNGSTSAIIPSLFNLSNKSSALFLAAFTALSLLPFSAT